MEILLCGLEAAFVENAGGNVELLLRCLRITLVQDIGRNVEVLLRSITSKDFVASWQGKRRGRKHSQGADDDC